MLSVCLLWIVFLAACLPCGVLQHKTIHYPSGEGIIEIHGLLSPTYVRAQ